MAASPILNGNLQIFSVAGYGRCRLNLSAGHMVGIGDQFESIQLSMFYGIRLQYERGNPNTRSAI